MPAVIAAYLVMELAVDYAVAIVVAEITTLAVSMVASSIIAKAFFNQQQPGGSGGYGSGSSANPGNPQQVPPATNNKLPVVYGSAYVGGIITDLSITSNNQQLYYVLSLSEVTNTNTGQTADNFTFGNIYYGGKKCLFGNPVFTSLGTVSTVATNTITFASISQPVNAGDVISFTNVGFPSGYTVNSFDPDTNTIVFASDVSGVASIGTAFYLYDQNAQTRVTGLLDESTGIIDTKIAGLIEIFLYKNGSNSPANSTQSAITVMQASGLTYKWDSTKLMTNTAFAIIHLTYNSSAGVTGIQQTQFQVINSRNAPGDCMADYFINTRYGAALPANQINYASLTALNTYSAQTFNGQQRFQFNGVVDTTQTVLSNMQDMANCTDSLIKYNEITAQWGVIVQTPSYSVAMDINDSNMISALSVSPLDVSSSYNIAEVKFPDKANRDTFNTAVFDLAQIDPSLLFPNEPINKQSFSLPYIDNSISAQYLAIRFLKSAREDLQIQVSINFVGLQLEAGDVVTVTNSNYGWVAKLFRVSKVIQTFETDGVIKADLTLMEYNPSVYDDASITAFVPSPNSGFGDPINFGTLYAPSVTGSQPSAANPYFQVLAESSSSGITQYAEIWYSAFSNPSMSQMIFAGTTAIQSNGIPYSPSTILPAVTLSNIPAGNWYFFSRMVNSLGNSNFSPASSVFVWRPTTFQFTEQYLSVAYADSITGTGFSLNPRNKTYYGLFNQSTSTPSTNPSDYTWYAASPVFGSARHLLYINRTGRKFSFATGYAGFAAGTGSFVPTEILLFDPSIWSGLTDNINIIDLDVRTGQLIQTGTTTVGTGQIAITNNTDGNIIASLQEYLDFGGAYTKTSSVATLTIDIYGRVVGFETPDDFDYTEQVFTATSGQTVFSVTRGSGYIIGQCLVFENGLLLDTSEYTDGASSVTFPTARTTGDIITIISFKSVNSTSGVYASFTRNAVTLSNQSTYTASGFTINDGFELLFLNGTIVNSQDYNLAGQTITFVGNASGDLEVLQWSANNLGVANGTPVNVDAYTVVGQTIYPFSFNINAFNLYNNGLLQKQGTDYTTASGTYTLTTSPTSSSNILVQQTFARTGAV